MYSVKLKTVAWIAGSFIAFATRSAIMAIVESCSSTGIAPSLQWRNVSLSLSFGLVLGGITMFFARQERKMEQQIRNSVALRLLLKIEKAIGDHGPGHTVPAFALYLRPFALEDTFQRWTLRSLSTRMLFLDSGSMRFDFFLQELLGYHDIHVVSIGIDDAQEGAGLIITKHDEWEERFRRLAHSATVIVLIPGISAGIQEEIHWLKISGLLPKTVFFKPKGYPRPYWKKLKSQYERQDGIVFPRYFWGHLSFRVHPSGHCYDLKPWFMIFGMGPNKYNIRQMRKLLNDE